MLSEKSIIAEDNQLEPILANAAKIQRILAAFIDYIVLFAISTLIFGNLTDNFTERALVCLLFLSYYTLGNSYFFNGQTLGKRLFSLQVVSALTPFSTITIIDSLKRYLSFLGAIFLLAEVPPLIYRANEVHADAWLLELPILFSLVYFFGGFFYFLADNSSRTPHDRIVRTKVVRLNSTQEEALQQIDQASIPTSMAATFGVALGLIFWLLSTVLHPQEVQFIQGHRHVIETKLPYEIVAASIHDSKLTLQLYSPRDAIYTVDQQIQQIDELLTILRQTGKFPLTVAKMEIIFYDKNSATGIGAIYEIINPIDAQAEIIATTQR